MLFIEGVDVVRTVIASVDDKFDLFITKNIKLTEQFLNRFSIRNITGKLAVIERKPGFFAKDQCQVDLRKFFTVFICPAAGRTASLLLR